MRRTRHRRAAAGLRSGSMTFSNSNTEPGQPCTSSRVRCRLRRPGVNGMDALTVHVHRDLPKRIQPSLTRPPVESLASTRTTLRGNACWSRRTSHCRELVEPPGTSQPFTQIIELVMRNVYLERHNTACHVFLPAAPIEWDR